MRKLKLTEEEKRVAGEMKEMLIKEPIMAKYPFSSHRMEKLSKGMHSMSRTLQLKKRAERKKRTKRKGKNNSGKLSLKEIKKRLCETGLNVEAITRNAEKYILESGIAPGLAEDIKARQRHQPGKRLFRKEAAY